MVFHGGEEMKYKFKKILEPGEIGYIIENLSPEEEEVIKRNRLTNYRFSKIKEYFNQQPIYL